MAETVIRILVGVAVSGLGVFLAVYTTTKPWQHTLGRMQLSFMASLAGAFVYALVARFLDRGSMLIGWIIMLSLVSGVVWWQTGLLVSYQLKARREERRQSDG